MSPITSPELSTRTTKSVKMAFRFYFLVGVLHSVSGQSCNTELSSNSPTSSSFICPTGCTSGRIWGDGIYTWDSKVCVAAVHAGAISSSVGGRVYVERKGRQTSFTGSTKNGVTSISYGDYYGSFIVFSTPVYTKRRGDCEGGDIGLCGSSGGTFTSCRNGCDSKSACKSFLFGHYPTNLGDGNINVEGWCCLKDKKCTTLGYTDQAIYTYEKDANRQSCNEFLETTTCTTSCSFNCPSGCTGGVIYGDGFYATDSDICTAAIHAGAISINGGMVYLRRIHIQTLFHASIKNNIQSTGLNLSIGWGAFSFDCARAPLHTPSHTDGAPCTNVVPHNTYCSWKCISGYKPDKPYRCQYGLWSTSVPVCVGCSPNHCGSNCTSPCSSNCKDSVCNRFDCHCLDCVDGKGGSMCATSLPAPAANPFTISERKGTSFKLYWSQCSEHSHVTGYYLYLSGAVSKTITVTETDTHHRIIGGLLEGRSYTVTMSCVNNLTPSSGTPKRSSSIDVTTCLVPSVPTILLTTQLKHGDTKKAEIKVAFQDAEHNCDGIASRIVYKNTDDIGVVCRDKTNCVIQDLIPYTVYAVRLKIINSGGLEATGSSVTITTSEGEYDTN